MLSTVASKPNHYERLGLEPDAGEEEIERAFAREMSAFRPHSVADIAEIAIAFKTLRDPERRRTYDASIAPPPEPAPEPEAELLAGPAESMMFPREGWPFIASARIDSADLPSIDSVARAASAPSREPFSALLEPPSDAPPEHKAPGTHLNADVQPVALQFVERSQVFHEHFRDEDRAGRGRTAITVGALFGGVAVLGAALGVYASRGIGPAQAQDVATVTLPKGSPPPAAEPIAADLAENASEPETAPRRAAAKHRRASHAAERAPVAEEVAEDSPADAQASETALVAAAMPLPDAVVARTIDRIGYSCGEVASTSSVDGGGGVFKVTCRSGNAFKATPVRGRYHFRRWGR